MQLANQEGTSQPAENNKIGFAARRAPNFSYRYLSTMVPVPCTSTEAGRDGGPMPSTYAMVKKIAIGPLFVLDFGKSQPVKKSEPSC